MLEYIFLVLVASGVEKLGHGTPSIEKQSNEIGQRIQQYIIVNEL